MKKIALITWLLVQPLFVWAANSKPSIGLDELLDVKAPWQLTTAEGQQQAVVTQPDLNGSWLRANGYYADTVVTFDYQLKQDAELQLFLHGRYAVTFTDSYGQYELSDNLAGSVLLANGDAPEGTAGAPSASEARPAGEWNRARVEFRGPRFDEARNKTAPAAVVSVTLNGEQIQKNVVLQQHSPGARDNWQDAAGPLYWRAFGNQVTMRNIEIGRADYSALVLPTEETPAPDNAVLVDLVQTGREHFRDFGCAQCHATERGDKSAKTGPNLYGVFGAEPAEHKIAAGGEGHVFTVMADDTYFYNSLRSPESQLALRENDSAYPPIMPAYSEQVIPRFQATALLAYLKTLNQNWNRGPLVHLADPGEDSEYNVYEDRLQFIVTDRTRLQRGPLPGVSARSIHVGLPGGINYSFDPRVLGIAKVWQGGYLDAEGELRNRGGKGFKTGFRSQEIKLGETGVLLAPLVPYKGGEAVADFSFKEAVWGDTDTIKASLNSERDHKAMLADWDAAFLSYTLNSQTPGAAPTFNVRAGDNLLELTLAISPDGTVEFTVAGARASGQRFALNRALLENAKVSAGKLAKGVWTIPAGKSAVTLQANLALAPDAWQPEPGDFAFSSQPLEIRQAEANLPAGYRIQSYMPPKDNLGREQLFEGLGVAEAENGALLVSTRTAGVWRLEDGQWTQFAQGTFDSLGLIVLDKEGRDLVVGQKAELSRITDTNGDGVADRYRTLFDAFSYHGNYHTYMHGPTLGEDGHYYLALNLGDGGDVMYKAGGKYMGTAGGYSGWAVRVSPEGDWELFASGLRSPASLGTGPDGRLWYADNQGEYMGTSKLFVVHKDGFYGHPAGLVDLPGMQPDSAPIQWEHVKDDRVPPAVLFPHNRVANSPGNPAWDTSGGEFGPFAGQMFIGDQTQSNLLRVVTETVNGHLQGAVMPFAEGLESGVMRPVFLQDGSLLLGQTGRGWQAKGGKVASLQRIYREAEAAPLAIRSVTAGQTGFTVELTRPLPESVERALSVQSWAYRDAPDYGSPELGVRDEALASVTLSDDRRTIAIELREPQRPGVHEDQTPWVYQLDMSDDGQWPLLRAWYTLHSFSE